MRVRREQVLVTIVVEILNACTPAAHFEAAESDARLVTVIAKKSIAFISEHRVGLTAKGGDDKAGLAIIVPIAKIHAHAGNGQSAVGVRDEGLDTHLMECFATAVAKKKISVIVIGDEDIHPAVIVVVRDGDAHSFADVPRDAHDF